MSIVPALLRRRRFSVSDAYAILGYKPELVLDFAEEYYRANSAATTFAGALTFARASAATYVDSTGTIQTASSGVARVGHHIWNGTSWVNEGLLLESEARTNLLHTTDALVTQSLTVTAVPHTLHFTGTGTVTLLGASTAGPLVGTGTGEQNRVSLTFTPIAASLTLTVTGTVTNAQLEVGSTPSSYIPNLAASGSVTRAAETLTVPAAKLPYSATAMSIQMQGRASYAEGSASPYFARLHKDGSNYIWLYINNFTNQLIFRQANAGVADLVGSVDAYSRGVNVPYNIASRHGSTFINGAVDGAALTANTTPTALPDLSATNLNLGQTYMGTIKSARMWAADITDAGLEAASVTAPLLFGLPTISGNTNQGATLTAASAPVVIGTPSPTTTWQWLRDGAPISGATSNTYVLTGDDVGSKISVRQTATNVGGTASATSAETATISAVPAGAIAQRDGAYILDRAGNYIEVRA